jgi:hypothetical protein
MRRTAFSALLAAGLACACCGQASAIVINATFDGNYTPEQSAIGQAAIDEWETTLLDSYTFDHVRMLIMDLSFIGSPLAATNISSGAYQPIGVGAEAACDTGWERLGGPVLVPWGADTYITIALNTAYVNQMYFGLAEPVPGGEYDALTIFRHELCHAVGFAEEYADFGAKLLDGPGSDRTYNGNGFTVEITPASQGTHVLGNTDLMSVGLGPGVRRDISADPDLRVLADAYGYGVPEPATIALLAVGLGGAVAWRRRGGAASPMADVRLRVRRLAGPPPG